MSSDQVIFHMISRCYFIASTKQAYDKWLGKLAWVCVLAGTVPWKRQAYV